MASEVEKAFIEHEITPDIVPVAPKNILNIAFRSCVSCQLGNELTPTQVQDIPSVTWEAEKCVYYTLLMIDPDAPSRVNHELRECRHWLVMNIPGCYVQKGDHIIEYIGSGPPEDTGLHRYTFLVYKQPGIIQHNEPRCSNRSTANRLKTFASEFAKKYNLGDPVFGNFFQAQYDEYSDILHAKLMGGDDKH